VKKEVVANVRLLFSVLFSMPFSVLFSMPFSVPFSMPFLCQDL